MIALLRSVAGTIFRRHVIGAAASIGSELALRAVEFLRARLVPPPAPVASELDRPLANAVGGQLEHYPSPDEEEVMQTQRALGQRLHELERYGAPPEEGAPRSSIARENQYDALIERAASRFSVPAAIVKGVIATESSFNAKATREEPKIADRSRGLMQILERTARGLGFLDDYNLLFDPEVNVTLGASLLAQLHKRFGTWEDALAAYNGGYPRRGADGKLVTVLAQYVQRVESNLTRWKSSARVVGTAGGLGLLGIGALVLVLARRARGGV